MYFVRRNPLTHLASTQRFRRAGSSLRKIQAFNLSLLDVIFERRPCVKGDSGAHSTSASSSKKIKFFNKFSLRKIQAFNLRI